jgi:hypothetical protein
LSILPDAMAPDSSAQDHGSGEINIAAQNSQKPTGRQWPLAKIDACSASEIEIDPAPGPRIARLLRSASLSAEAAAGRSSEDRGNLANSHADLDFC